MSKYQYIQSKNLLDLKKNNLTEQQILQKQHKNSKNDIYLPYISESILPYTENLIPIKSKKFIVNYITPKVTVVKNDDFSGYFTISWEPNSNVIMYLISIFNGISYQYLFVDKNKSTWSTKGKGIFPKTEHIQKGDIQFRADGSGTDFALDPFQLYSKACQIYGNMNDSCVSFEDTQKYFVRINSVNSNGDIHSLCKELKIVFEKDT